MSISAFYLLKRRHEDFSRRSFRIALFVAAASALLLLVSGDTNGRMIAREQPAKLAAFEGLYRTGSGGTGIHLFGIPDDDEQRLRMAVTVPGALSFLVYRDFHTPVAGLDRFPEGDRPPVAVPFFSFHLMVALGTFFIVLTLLSLWFLARGSLFRRRWLLGVWVFAVLGAFAANELGWIAAEVGRQPWIVQPKYADVVSGQAPLADYATTVDFSRTIDGLRTADAASPGVSSGEVIGSIVMFGLIYGMLFLVWVFVLNSKIQHGPEEEGGEEGAGKERGFLAAASARPGGESMTDAKRGTPEMDPPDRSQESH
jgi:cytochrome d ubiquinol oxidase subunit I